MLPLVRRRHHSRECGNYVNLDVALGRECCRWYAGVIARWTEEQLAYPEA